MQWTGKPGSRWVSQGKSWKATTEGRSKETGNWIETRFYWSDDDQLFQLELKSEEEYLLNLDDGDEKKEFLGIIKADVFEIPVVIRGGGIDFSDVMAAGRLDKELT